MKVDQAKRLKAFEKENSRLKQLVAEKELDIQILKEAMVLNQKTSTPDKAGKPLGKKLYRIIQWQTPL